jgi:hypothetical protein
VIGAAVMVGRIATGEITETPPKKNQHAVALGKLGGAKGGKARASSLSAVARTRAARKAAKARWRDSADLPAPSKSSSQTPSEERSKNINKNKDIKG